MPKRKNKTRNVPNPRADVGEANKAVDPPKQERPSTIGAASPEEQVLKESHVSRQTSEITLGAGPSSAASIIGLKLETETARPKFKLVRRPDRGGTYGRPIKLIANYLLLKFDAHLNIYHYDVEIKHLRTSILNDTRTAKEDALKNVSHIEHQIKRAPGKQRCREILSQMISSEMLKKYPAVYDGQKNIYALKEFPFEGKKTFTVLLKDGDRCNTFEVTLSAVDKGGGRNYIRVSDLSAIYEGRTAEVPQEVVMVFETVMNHREPPFIQLQLGSSFIHLQQEPEILKPDTGFHLKSGYNQSVHLTQRGPAVVVNHTVKAFHQPGSVIKYVKKILGYDEVNLRSKMSSYDVKTLRKRLLKVKVRATHQKFQRKYTIVSVSEESARDLRIKDSDKTVATYFRETYFPLKYPNLPCLEMRSTKTCYLPLEVCDILPNQPVLKDQEGPQNAQIIRKTAIKPQERFARISEHVEDIRQFSGEAMAQFRLNMAKDFMSLQGRVLPAPKIKYQGDGPGVEPDNAGTWRINRNRLQISAAAVKPCSWVVIDFASCENEVIGGFIGKLRAVGNKHGMNLEHPKFIDSIGDDVETYNALRRAKEAKVNFALVVVLPPPKGKKKLANRHCYEKVKFLAEIKLGLLTQCIQSNTIETFDPEILSDVMGSKKGEQIATNLVLKLNAKLGGVNHALVQRPKLLNQPAIIFGADVVHWPRGRNYPSIAAVVGSSDQYPFQYVVNCKTQTNRDEGKISQEEINDLKDMVKKILRVFKTKYGRKPMNIVFFRDGVSEGQFSRVGNCEVPMIQEACFEELDGFVPPLTFVVVQKNHQTRFLPQDYRDGLKRTGNVPAGTTVDTDVVHPLQFDFFLCSHEGIQGTSKPAHYTVIYDENGFSSNVMQKLCYELCYMYASCNRSISIPTPVMYADLACTRAKTYADLFVKTDSSNDGNETERNEGQRQFPDEVEDAINGIGEAFQALYFI